MATRRSNRLRSQTVDSQQGVNPTEIPNPFAANAQSFAPFGESISAIGASRRRSHPFGPIVPVALPELSINVPRTSTFSGDIEYQQYFDATGNPVFIATPRGSRPLPTNQPPISPSHSARQRRAARTASADIDRLAAQLAAADENPPEGSTHSEHHSEGGISDEGNPDETEDPPNPPAGDPPSGPPGGGGGGPPGGGGGGNDGHESDDSDSNDRRIFLETADSLRTVLGGLGTIIQNNSSSASSEGKARVKEPEVFDGTEPRKLKSFLASLSLVFLDRPTYFTESRKVMYTLSYLGGIAKEWFEPDILDPDPTNLPAWTYSFRELVRELSENFGLYDAQGEAEEKLGNLRMRDNEQIRKYNVRFNSLAVLTDWDTSALKWAYQRGLAPRLKDEMARIPEPRSLAEYRQEVVRLDNRYWRREEEKKREANRNASSSGGNQGSGKKGNKTTPTVNVNVSSTGNRFVPNSNRNSNNQSNNNNNNNRRSNRNNNRSNPSTQPKPWANKLDADGKLKGSELEYRKKNGLCTYCGSNKHLVANCDKKPSNQPSNQPRGRKTQTEEEPTPSTSKIEEVSEK